jgi:hypothetical protein
MTMRDAVKEKRSRVETILLERTVADVISRFDDRSISSVVVTDHADVQWGLWPAALRALARRGTKVL